MQAYAWPLALQILLTMMLLPVLGLSRVRAVRARRAHPRDFRVRQHHDDDWLNRINDHIKNQFELPVLFYALIAMAVALEVESEALGLLLWGFVLSRLVHTFIHLGGNNVLHRLAVFVIGWMFLLAGWALLLWPYLV